MYFGVWTAQDFPIESISAEFFRWWISMKRQSRHFDEEPVGQSPQRIEHSCLSLVRLQPPNDLSRIYGCPRGIMMDYSFTSNALCSLIDPCVNVPFATLPHFIRFLHCQPENWRATRKLRLIIPVKLEGVARSSASSSQQPVPAAQQQWPTVQSGQNPHDSLTQSDWWPLRGKLAIHRVQKSGSKSNYRWVFFHVFCPFIGIDFGLI
jgi:hypothetical protein